MYCLPRVCRSSLIIKRCISTTRKRKGYIVLVPEIGEDLDVISALIKPDGLPQFNGLTVENCQAAIAKQARCLEQTVTEVEESLTTSPVNPADQIFKRLEDITNALEITWGIAKTLYLGHSSLMPTTHYMNIHDRARIARASKFNSLKIYESLKGVLETGEIADKEEKRLCEKYVLEGKLNGLDLDANKRIVLNEILKNMGNERANYKNKLQTITRQFSHTISDYSLVRDFPADFLESIAVDPNNPTNGPWKISLQPQVVENFLKYCPNRDERWNIWQADVRKASGAGNKSLENSTHIEKIRALRKRQSQLLGFPNYAVMSMETKMVKSVESIKNIFHNLVKHAGPAQAREINQLQEFATKSGFDRNLEAYDIHYWERKQLKSEFNLDEEILREYFPLPKVLEGLFRFSENLFDIKFRERNDVETWHPNVKYFDIFDGASSSSGPVAGIYIDCFSKANQNGEKDGWMVGIGNRNEAYKIKPLTALIFNFNATNYGKPYLLSMRDLRMVFKNFGTALQHLLTKARYSDLAGLSNIEWDASQICGHVLMNFLENPEILKTISGHYSSNESVPDDVIVNVNRLQTHMAGHRLCKEIYYADLDIELHRSDDFWLDVVKRLWPVYMCMPLDKKDSHPCSMVDVFAGNWAAAVYSDLFSKLLAADIYTMFLEKPEDMQIVGKRFKETFLAHGGSKTTAENFRVFRGRDPSLNAFVESLNLLDSEQETDF